MMALLASPVSTSGQASRKTGPSAPRGSAPVSGMSSITAATKSATAASRRVRRLEAPSQATKAPHPAGRRWRRGISPATAPDRAPAPFMALAGTGTARHVDLPVRRTGATNGMVWAVSFGP